MRVGKNGEETNSSNTKIQPNEEGAEIGEENRNKVSNNNKGTVDYR